MARVRQWEHPHHRAAGICLLCISCAFPVLEPARLSVEEVVHSIRSLLQLPIMSLFHIRRRMRSLFYPEWRGGPWLVTERDHASNIVLAILVMKETYPALRLGEQRRLARVMVRRLKELVPSDFLLRADSTSDSEADFMTPICPAAVTLIRFLPGWHPPDEL